MSKNMTYSNMKFTLYNLHNVDHLVCIVVQLLNKKSLISSCDNVLSEKDMFSIVFSLKMAPVNNAIPQDAAMIFQ